MSKKHAPGRNVYQVYRDKAGLWRWRLKGGNGLIVADSGQGYKTQRGAIEGIRATERAVCYARTIVHLDK